MRPTRQLLSLLVTLTPFAGCTGPSSDGVDPAALPAVFPPPDQMIDDRAITSNTSSEKPPAPPDKSPPTVTDVRFLGPVDQPSEIRLVFDRPMATEPLPSGAWSMTPSFDGELTWVDATTLAFRPAKPFPLAAHYDVSLSGVKSAAGTALASPRTFVVNTRRLALDWGISGNPQYPRQQGPNEGVTLSFNMKVDVAAVQAATTFFIASSQAELTAGGGVAVPTVVAESKETNWDGSKPILARPRDGFQLGKWYRLVITKTLAGEGGVPLDNDIVGYYQGPERLRVTDIGCGWNGCTSVDAWRVSFNNPVSEKGLAGCFRFEPNLGVDRIDVQGYSVEVYPRQDPAVGKEVTLKVTKACRDEYGTTLADEVGEIVEIKAPRAALKMPVGTGYVTPAAEGEPFRLRVGAAHTGELTIGKKRVTLSELPAFLAKNIDEWGGLSLGEIEPDTTMQVTPAAASESAMVDVPIDLDDALGARALASSMCTS